MCNCSFFTHLPFTLDCSWVDMESWVDINRVLMKGENTSDVDVSFLRKLREFFCPVRVTNRLHSSDRQEGEKEQICFHRHSYPPKDHHPGPKD